MRKLIAILAIVMVVGGCATVKDWFCNNRVIIENSITQAQNLITAITTTFGTIIPPEYVAIIAQAQIVIDMGNNYLNTVTCPTDAQVAEVQAQQQVMQAKTQAAAKVMLKK